MTMKTRELAEILSGEFDTDIIEARLLLFLAIDFTDGYSERRYERWIAQARGKFWLPCITCGRWYGGQEEHGGSIMINESQGTIICSKCWPDARRLNERWPRGISEARIKPSPRR